MADNGLLKSGNGAARDASRRASRTRSALIAAFNQLFLDRRRTPIRAQDVIAAAGIGRSTFYEHYAGADALLLESMRAPLSGLADAILGREPSDELFGLLRHFWENRRRGREMLTGRLRSRVETLFVEIIEERLPPTMAALPRRLVARQIAEASLAPIRAWLIGEASCPPDALAEGLRNAAQALAALAVADHPARS